MAISDWLSLVFICMLGAMSPGPSLAVVLKHAFNNSAKHAMVASVTHGFGVGLYALASILGLSILINQHPLVYQILLGLGALYLVYLAISLLRSQGGAVTVTTKTSTENYSKAALDGFSIAFFNPKLAIFFLALFSPFISPDNSSALRAAIMCATVFTIDTAWYLLVSVISAKVKQTYASANVANTINKLLGVLFLLLAGKVIYSEWLS